MTTTEKREKILDAYNDAQNKHLALLSFISDLQDEALRGEVDEQKLHEALDELKESRILVKKLKLEWESCL